MHPELKDIQQLALDLAKVRGLNHCCFYRELFLRQSETVFLAKTKEPSNLSVFWENIR